MSNRRFMKDWQNIGRKLPLLTLGLLSVTVCVVSVVAYREMKRSLVTAAGQRVLSVSKQMADVFAGSNIKLQHDGSPLSHDSTLSAALVHPDSASLAAAMRRLETERAHGASVASVELWNARGVRVLLAGKPIGQLIAHGEQDPARSRSAVEPLVAVHDTVLSQVRLPVLGAAHDTIGFVREFSTVSSAQSRQVLSGLIGGRAELLIGNVAGDVWTDLNGKVNGPGAINRPGTMGQSTAADGSIRIGAVSAVAGTPWLIWVALPEADVISQARAFLVRMAFLSFIVIAFGAFGAWRMSRHIIAPMAAVTNAAERLAAGDYSSRAAVVRSDEVGRLAVAFNAMASSIQAASLDLENQQVELEMQHTELEEANEALRENIDEATNARRAAERSQARAAAIVAGDIAAVITTDRAGVIAEFNPAAEAIFGCTAAKAIGQPLDAFVPSTGGDLASYLERRGLRSRAAVEVSALRADGREFSAELAVTRIPVPGPPMFTCFLRDLSERKALEAQLQQSQKMEAVGRLAGGVAHDFNNILTVIISYADLVLSDPDMGELVRTDLAQIRTAADRATALTRQLLAFSRKQVLHPAVLDINAVVGDVSTMLARVIPSNIRLETRLGESVPSVYVDRGQLEQVLMNLAVNARDAMPEGGSLTIETAAAVLDEAYVALHPGGVVGPHVVLSVLDSGVGMDAETRERIFEPFFTTKSLGQGTGLGLATVYGIVQQSGGSVYVYSEPGRGTTFKVYFPACAVDGAQAEEDTIGAPLIAAGPLTVLLVEDDPAVREATRLVLERLGHEVVPAENVASALEIIGAGVESLDVVLTDAVMPGQSGLDLAEILRAEHPELPVILMSGYTEKAVSGGRSVPRGVVFVEKPFTAEVIAAALSEVRSSVRALV